MPTETSPILEPLECPASDVASVPRRFGVGVLLILMTAFAVLFATMRTCHAPPEIFIVVAGLFLGVTLGQILLFQGKLPRQASLAAGAVVFPLVVLAVRSCDTASFTASEGFADLVLCAILGAPFGYLAGCIMASVFLVQEEFHRRRGRTVKIELLPLTAADFDTLISWVQHLQLFALWSQGKFRYPLDHNQLAAHLGQTAGDPPDRLCFKAVCGEMQQMVAFVELANIDRDVWLASIAADDRLAPVARAVEIKRAGPHASIELAIVDPSRNDREYLSDVLVQEIVQHAFQQQGLQWLDVVLHHSLVQSPECFRKQGFHDAGRVTRDKEWREYLRLIRMTGT